MNILLIINQLALISLKQQDINCIKDQSQTDQPSENSEEDTYPTPEGVSNSTE